MPPCSDGVAAKRHFSACVAQSSFGVAAVGYSALSQHPSGVTAAASKIFAPADPMGLVVWRPLVEGQVGHAQYGWLQQRRTVLWTFTLVESFRTHIQKSHYSVGVWLHG